MSTIMCLCFVSIFLISDHGRQFSDMRHKSVSPSYIMSKLTLAKKIKFVKFDTVDGPGLTHALEGGLRITPSGGGGG